MKDQRCSSSGDEREAPTVHWRILHPCPRGGGALHVQWLVSCVIGLYGLLCCWHYMVTPRLDVSTITTQQVHNKPQGLAFPIKNVALLGQFNYDIPAAHVQSWVTIWSKYFTTISVVGPFSDANYRMLRERGVDVHLGANDKGYVSPVKNVADALERAPPGIDAVLYVHDDGLLNLTMFAGGRSHIPTDRFMGNLHHVPRQTYSITVPPHDEGEIIYDIPGHAKTPTTNPDKLIKLLPYWYWNNHCLDQHRKMVKKSDSSIKDYATKTLNDGSFYFFASHGQQDFLLVPMIYKDPFIRIARFFIESEVFLECSFPTIVLWLIQEEQRRKNGTTKEYFTSSILLQQEATYIPICTSWDESGPNVRGTVNMLEHCFNTSKPHGMYHPVKLSVYNATGYAQWLDRIQQPVLPA